MKHSDQNRGPHAGDRIENDRFETSEPLETRFRKDFESHRYSEHGHTFEDFLPAYAIGEELSRDPDYQNHDWPDVEPEARRRFIDRGVGSWDAARAAVHYGFEQGRGRNLRL